MDPLFALRAVDMLFSLEVFGALPRPEDPAELLGFLVRRAIASAVQRVIEQKAFADLSAHDATSHKDPAVREMGRAIERGTYRGERKRARAMRRLLRAAGLTTEKTRQ